MANLPERIGKYRIDRVLGKGAMGIVYEGFDPLIERRVAIKTILKDYLDRSEGLEILARFKREAQAAGRLNHPNIIGVYEYGEDDQGAFIAMEYADGSDLQHLLRQGPALGLGQIQRLMGQLLAGLHFAHTQGIVHRDIKPANLMILNGLQLKIMDFGIARLESASMTQAGTVMGTPTYMAPEQLLGLTADARADVWSAGVVLYELVTGLNPFLEATTAAVMHRVLQVMPKPPSALAPGLPWGLDALLLKALAKDRSDRFRTAADLLAALAEVLPASAEVGDTMAMDAFPSRTLALAAEVPKVAWTLPPETLSEVERSLLRAIGPLARMLMRQAREQAASPEAFIRMLAGNIEDEGERATFLGKLQKVAQVELTRPPLSSEPPPSPRPEVTPEALATAEKRLASYLGPMARVLIKQAVGKSGNLKEIYQHLASNIEDEAERKAFLASLGH